MWSPAERPRQADRERIMAAGRKGTPRPGGGRGVGGGDAGGPDRIRTGDLQRDRLACWAATPRVRGRRVGRIAGAAGVVPIRIRSGDPSEAAARTSPNHL